MTNLRKVADRIPANLDARRDLARYLALSGEVVEASKVLGQLPPQAQTEPASNAVRALIHFAALATDDAARSDASRASAARALLGGSPDAAIESLLSRMQADRVFATRAGREDLLQAFALLPADDARVTGWRRRLAALAELVNDDITTALKVLAALGGATLLIWIGIIMVKAAKRGGGGMRGIGAALMMFWLGDHARSAQRYGGRSAGRPHPQGHAFRRSARQGRTSLVRIAPLLVGDDFRFEFSFQYLVPRVSGERHRVERITRNFRRADHRILGR